MDSEEFSGMEGDLNLLDLGIQGKNDKKRRFSEQQIKSLETMFETQTKLEPRKKLQLARELGLQPRQVAIWFQNKRARWKSKQLEREYNALRSDYDKLLSNFEALKKEKQVLAKQLQKLAELIDKQRDDSSNEGDSSDGDRKRSEDMRPGQGSDLRVVHPAEEEKKLSYMSQDEVELIGAPTATSWTSTEQECCFDSTSFPDQQWWEFWPLSE